MITLRNLILTLFAAATFTAATAQDEPIVTTDTRFARGATMAFCRATYKVVNNNGLKERGICYSSTTKTPTIDDSRTTKTFNHNGFIYRLQDLQPATKYYARAYAIASNGSVGYGNVIKIVTIPKGTIGWDYDNGADEAANTRINNAVQSCVDYWNNLTSIQGLWLSVHYGSGTPTADCSYGGWMRVGPNASYQRTGTIMHEALHAIGVGQHDMWYGGSSPLRAGSGTGRWLGDRTTDFIRFWDNDNTAVANGDGTHIWPYGINGANEDTGSEVLYTATSLLAQAVGEDGLPPTWGQAFGSPYYAFDQEDDVKYYIKSESETYGLQTAFLVETADHKLRWQAMSAEEAAANDAAAWYVTFTPNNQYYQFRNAATGYYITYKDAGSDGMVTEQHAAPTANDNFHLMRSRCDVKNSAGSVITAERGYWILHPDNGQLNPPALMAKASGGITVASRDFTDKATAQRWLILTAKQAKDMTNTALRASRDAYYLARAQAQAFLATPHIELTEDADATLQAAFVTYDAACEAAESAADVNAATLAIATAGKAFLKSVCAADLEHPFNLTAMLKNPDFATDKSGWTEGSGTAGTWNYQSVEFYQKKINVYQALAAMPLGTYEAHVQAFQRPGGYSDVYGKYTAGTDNVDAKLYIQASAYGEKIKNIMADRAPKSLHSDDKQMADKTYIPNTMASAAAHFKAGYYDNQVQRFMPADGRLQIGLFSSANEGSGYWTIFTNFRLYYYGPLTLDEIQARIDSLKAKPGDIDGDGQITMADANMVVNAYLGQPLDAAATAVADVDGDGQITMADANAIVNMYLGD